MWAKFFPTYTKTDFFEQFLRMLGKKFVLIKNFAPEIARHFIFFRLYVNMILKDFLVKTVRTDKNACFRFEHG